MLVLIFVLDCFVVLREMRSPRLVGSIFVATGVGLGAAIRQMRGLWREKFNTETLIALLPALGEAEVRKVILQLLGTLGKR